MNIEEVLREGINSGASDVHLVKGNRPLFRINRELIEMQQSEPLTRENMDEIYVYFTKENREYDEVYEKEKRLDINFEIDDTRLRVNISLSDGIPTFTARIIRRDLPAYRNTWITGSS